MLNIPPGVAVPRTFKPGLLVMGWSGLGWVHTTQGKKLLPGTVFLALMDSG